MHRPEILKQTHISFRSCTALRLISTHLVAIKRTLPHHMHAHTKGVNRLILTLFKCSNCFKCFCVEFKPQSSSKPKTGAGMACFAIKYELQPTFPFRSLTTSSPPNGESYTSSFLFESPITAVFKNAVKLQEMEARGGFWKAACTSSLISHS